MPSILLAEALIIAGMSPQSFVCSADIQQGKPCPFPPGLSSDAQCCARRRCPAKITYLTDGPNKNVPIGRRSIHLKHARPISMAGRDGKFALVVQALQYLGEEGVGTGEIETLRRSLSAAEKRELVKGLRIRRGMDLRGGEEDCGAGCVNRIVIGWPDSRCLTQYDQITILRLLRNRARVTSTHDVRGDLQRPPDAGQ